jgi:hypothetical protein
LHELYICSFTHEVHHLNSIQGRLLQTWQNMALHCSHNSKNTCFKLSTAHAGSRGNIPHIDDQLLLEKLDA